MRRFIYITLFIISATPNNAISQSIAKDSILNRLSNISENKLQIKMYRDLADICFETPEETTYLREMHNRAEEIGDKHNIINALVDMSIVKIKDNQIDSAYYYLEKLKNAGTNKETLDGVTFLKLRLFDAEISGSKGQNTVASMLESSADGNSNIYTKLERAYIIGNGLLSQKRYNEAMPYIQTAFDVSMQLPPKEANKFQTMTSWLMANCYQALNQGEQTIAIIEDLIDIQLSYYNRYYKTERPFYNINTRIVQNYSFILTNLNVLSDDSAKNYLQRLMDLTENATNKVDRYSRYIAINNYHLHRREYEKALVANDSLIKIATGYATYILPALYDVSSRTYAALGRYEEALGQIKISHHIKDSLSSEEANNQIRELQVKYDVDRLNYENSQLEIQKKRITSWSLAIMLAITVTVCVYLFYNLKREKRTKKKLEILHAKAEQSDIMKVAFLNSICHEIRTPLNSIVGFSNLIFDQTIDIETQKSFAELIRHNTFLLTSLVDNMLEVSNLDSSQDKLPCEDVSLNALCINAISRASEKAKENIEYKIDITEEDMIICTHTKYLNLVIEQLLDNSSKFTEQGTITLGYTADRDKNRLFMTVTDTGCGIPTEKHDDIFKRFFKLNTFTQGSGLGLYLCQLIITRLNGDIAIDPQYTDGAKFIITLPIRQQTVIQK